MTHWVRSPFYRVKNIKVDMRESEHSYGLLGIEYMMNIEEYSVDRISVCEAHRYEDIYIRLPMNTSHYKTHPSTLHALAGDTTEEEHNRPENRMVTSDINGAGESVSDNAIGAHCDKFSPKPILIDQHKLDPAIKAIHSNSNKQEDGTVLLDSKNIHKRYVCPGTSTPSPNTPSSAE